jgi:hypothetical protein
MSAHRAPVECYVCGKKGHVSKNCWQNKNQEQPPYQYQQEQQPPQHKYNVYKIGKKYNASNDPASLLAILGISSNNHPGLVEQIEDAAALDNRISDYEYLMKQFNKLKNKSYSRFLELNGIFIVSSLVKYNNEH